MVAPWLERRAVAGARFADAGLVVGAGIGTALEKRTFDGVLKGLLGGGGGHGDTGDMAGGRARRVGWNMFGMMGIEAASGQPERQGGGEGCLTSIRPVTAAEITEVRYSRNRSIVSRVLETKASI